MTLQEAQNILHYKYQGDDNTPSSSSEDWTLRTAYFNEAIRLWEREAQWRELYTTLAAASDGDKTTVDGTATYTAPSNLKSVAGYLRIVNGSSSEYYRYVDVSETSIYDNDSSSRFFYVTGNDRSGRTIHIHPTPTTTGLTISYEYYKSAAALSDASDVIEMSDPDFVVFYALSVLFESDGQGDRAEKALGEASARLKQMKVNTLIIPALNENRIKDVHTDLGISGFGI